MLLRKPNYKKAFYISNYDYAFTFGNMVSALE